MPAIIRTFPVAAYAPSGDPVIDVTSLFTTDVPELSARRRRWRRRARHGRDPDVPREGRLVPDEHQRRGDADLQRRRRRRRPRPAPAPAPGGRGGGGGGPSTTILVSHSMVKLPEKPMMPRLFDERVGYFTQGVTDYETGEQQAMQKRFITRYRLEKKDPNAAVSEPVKPIVYYVDPATPKKWVPYIKKGIEDWQPAFEAAGFKNAIIAKEAPAGRSGLERRGRALLGGSLAAVDDRERVGSARARSAQRRDPQRGHPVLPQRHEPGDELVLRAGRPARSARAEAAAARRSDGRLIEYVVAHEVGHTLGFQHNMKASSPYTIEQIRDPKWVKENGHTPTLMDYSRFNYVAQPEDKHRPGGPDPEDRAVRQVGDAVGLRADSGREDAGRREADARQVGARAGREAVPALLDRRRRRHRSGRQDRSRRRRRRGEGHRRSASRTWRASPRCCSRRRRTQDRRSVRRARTRSTAAWSASGPPRWATSSRSSAASTRKQKHIGQEGVRFTTVPKARQVEALQFLLDQRVHDAVVHDPAGDPAADPADGRRRPRRRACRPAS